MSPLAGRGLSCATGDATASVQKIGGDGIAQGGWFQLGKTPDYQQSRFASKVDTLDEILQPRQSARLFGLTARPHRGRLRQPA
jgi:hypothetical protein